MTKKETIQVLQSIENRAVDFPYMTACDWVAIAAAKRHLENSLKVKEVDLEKEYEEFVVDDPILGNFITNDTMGMKLAKHFFELGFMYTLSWKDIKLIAEIGEEFMNSEESDAYTNDESYYNAILNKLKEKGLDYKTQRQEMRDIKAQKGK